MPGRVTAAQRKTMLRLAREGISQSEIMKRLNIWDRRTLKRNLELAEGEERAGRVKEKELEKATTAHMAEIRAMIERWKDCIKMSKFAIGEDALVGCRSKEKEPLFECIKEHLPFESLWRDYDAWKGRHIKYVGWGKKLLEDVVEEGERRMRIGRRNYYYPGAKLTEKFANPMVKALDISLMGGKPRAFEFKWEMVGQEGQWALYVDGEDVMVVEAGKGEGEGYERRYQEVFDACVEKHIKGLFNDLSTLGEKIEAELGELLICRAYIGYECKLCPGRLLK